MKGQIRISFIFSIVAFGVILFYIFSQTNMLFTALVTDAKSDVSKALISNTLNVLLQDSGYPENWEVLPNPPERVGLSTGRPNDLSESKINKLYQNCSYLDDYKLDSYSLTISNSTHLLLDCGHNYLESPSAFYSKYASVGNDIAFIMLKIW